MKKTTKAFLGWFAILFISLIPVFLWFKLGPEGNAFSDYASTVHSLGEIFGLVGMTMFALTFVLSTRIRFIEDVFGGLDKVYIAHGILGGTALILVLFHPILLVLKFIPQNLAQAAIYLLPSSYWSTNFGIMALTGMMALVYLTLFTKMKYHRWKFTHEFLGLMFFFAVLHIFLVRGQASSDYIFKGYYYYASIVSFIGLGAFSYSLFIKKRIFKNAVYTIKDIQREGDTFTLKIVPQHKPINYKSGQFVFMRFYNKYLSKETHPFSIASKSNSGVMKIVIKSLGDFTSKLEHLSVGEKVSLEGPYGRFHFRNYHGKKQVWIAAGIGVTPFLGMVEDLDEMKDPKTEVDFYHSVKNNNDFVGYDVLSYADKKIKGFRFIPWNSSVRGRLDVEHIQKISGDYENTEFFLCGPTGFKESLIHKLIKLGVKKNNIHEEAFDFR